MSEPRRLPPQLAYVLGPLLLLPLVLGALLPIDNYFVVLAVAICVVAPLGGLWRGEVTGHSAEGRAVRGCFWTSMLFVIYITWTFFAVPWLVWRFRAWLPVWR